MNDQQQRAFRALTSAEGWFVAGWNAGVNAAREQADPVSNAELLTDQEIAEYAPGDVTVWAYEDMLYFAREIEAAVLARAAKQQGGRHG